MQKVATFIASNTLVQAVLSILLGLLLAIWPQITTITVVYIFAACLAVAGIASLITSVRGRKDKSSGPGSLLIGLFFLIVAVAIFIFPEVVTGLFAVIFGAILVLSGLVDMFRSAALKTFSGNAWVVMLIISLLIIVGGIVIIVYPFEAAVTFTLILGILLVVKGIADLIISYLAAKDAKAVDPTRRR